MHPMPGALPQGSSPPHAHVHKPPMLSALVTALAALGVAYAAGLAAASSKTPTSASMLIGVGGLAVATLVLGGATVPPRGGGEPADGEGRLAWSLLTALVFTASRKLSDLVLGGGPA